MNANLKSEEQQGVNMKTEGNEVLIQKWPQIKSLQKSLIDI